MKKNCLLAGVAWIALTQVSFAAQQAKPDATQMRPDSRQRAPSAVTLSPSSLGAQLGVSLSAARTESATSAVPLALNAAVHQSVNRHPAIADAIATMAQQAGGVDVARAGYYPRVSVGLSGGRNNAAVSQNTGVGAVASVSQMLYDFGKVDGAVDQSEAALRRQQAVVLRQIDAIAQQAAEAVVMAHRYQALVAIAQEQVTAVGKVLEMAQLRAGAGISTRADPIQATSRYDGARANLLQMKSQQMQWRERLRTLLGRPVPEVIAPLPDALTVGPRLGELPDIDLLPDLLVAQAEMRAAAAQLAMARAQRYPTISLDGSVTKALNGVNAATGERNGANHTLMINMSVLVYQGGAVDAQIRGAIAAEEAARQRIEVARLNASDQARSYRELAIGAEARLSVLADRKRSIVEARDLYREQYTLGTRSILDLLNAEQEIQQAAADQEAVLHDLWQNRIAFVAATGQSRAFYNLNNTLVQGMELLP